MKLQLPAISNSTEGAVANSSPYSPRTSWIHMNFLRKSLRQFDGGGASLRDRLVQLATLGKGSTGSVWTAVDVKTLQMVAVKEVSVIDVMAETALMRELSTLRSQLAPLTKSTARGDASGKEMGPHKFRGCPHIPYLFGAFLKESNGIDVCIALQYQRGYDLQQWIDLKLCHPEAWLAHIARQALKALRFLHDRNCIHGDVKTANLVVGSSGDAKLVDFGTTLRADNHGTRSTLLGTRRFMSPERLWAQPYGTNADVWSLGISIAAVALGENPLPEGPSEFEALGFAENAFTYVSEHPQAQGLSSGLLDFLSQCLTSEANARPEASVMLQHPFLLESRRWEQGCDPECAGVLEALRRRPHKGGGARASEEEVQATIRKVLEVRRQLSFSPPTPRGGEQQHLHPPDMPRPGAEALQRGRPDHLGDLDLCPLAQELNVAVDSLARGFASVAAAQATPAPKRAPKVGGTGTAMETREMR
ncbi:unnamed protein product, partial [Discosporangium mesarthrocarpum]